MPALLARLRDIRFLRYLLASLGALGVDMGCFLALLAIGAGAVPASATGYSAGIAAHWLLSSRAVFTGQVAPRGFGRHRQKALFILSALLGLVLTTAIVDVGESVGIDPRFAKLVAVGTSFLATWLMRSRIVFRAPVAA